jgi:hypothetical protein
MKKLLSPRWKFVCDRCGKEIFPNEDNCINMDEMNEIAFLDSTDMRVISKKINQGEICKECYNDFVELANNFFDDVNKTESEGNI